MIWSPNGYMIIDGPRPHPQFDVPESSETPSPSQAEESQSPSKGLDAIVSDADPKAPMPCGVIQQPHKRDDSDSDLPDEAEPPSEMK